MDCNVGSPFTQSIKNMNYIQIWGVLSPFFRCYKFGKFMDLLKKLYINMLFINGTRQISSYARLLKDMISKKIKLSKFVVILIEERSVRMQKKLPPRLKAPRSFIMPIHL